MTTTSVRSTPRLIRDTENHVGDLAAASDYERRAVADKNGLDFAVEGINAAVAGVPVVSWITGGVTVAYGLYKLAWALDGQPSCRNSGLKTIVAGLVTPVPGLGQIVNGSLAIVDGFEAAGARRR